MTTVKIALEHDEYWMASYHDYREWMDEEPEGSYAIVEVDSALIEAERTAFEAWRASVRAIYEAAGHGDSYG